MLGSFRKQAVLQAEIVALRHQLTVLQRTHKRLMLNRADRWFWVWLFRLWSGWRSTLAIVKPETVIAWHRAGFRRFWTWKVRRGQPGRPLIPRKSEIQNHAQQNSGSPSTSSPCPLSVSRSFTYFWYWPMTDGILHFHVTAHPTRSGRHRNCWMPLPLANSRVTYYVTAIRFSARTSKTRCATWAAANRARARLGSERTSSECLDHLPARLRFFSRIEFPGSDSFAVKQSGRTDYE